MLPGIVRRGWEDRSDHAVRQSGRRRHMFTDGACDAADRARAQRGGGRREPGGGGPRRAGRRAAHGRPGGHRARLHPRRRGHREDPHDHPPHRLRRAHRRLRARAGARRDVHGSGRGRAAGPAGRPRRRGRPGTHLPRRGDAPAAVLRPAGARRSDALAGREQAAPGGDGGEPLAVVDRPRQPARPRQRDRVGEDDPRHARRLPGARQGRRPGAAVRGRRRRGGLLQLRVRQAARRRAGLRGPPARDRLRARGAPRRRPRGARAVPALRRRRVPGREPPAAAAAGRLARRPRRDLRRR